MLIFERRRVASDNTAQELENMRRASIIIVFVGKRYKLIAYVSSYKSPVADELHIKLMNDSFDSFSYSFVGMMQLREEISNERYFDIRLDFFRVEIFICHEER